MVKSYIKHLEEFSNELAGRVDKGTLHLINGKYNHAKRNFNGVYDDWRSITSLPNHEREAEQKLVKGIKYNHLRASFGLGLSEGPSWRNDNPSAGDVYLMGGDLEYGLDIIEKDKSMGYEEINIFGLGVGALGFMKEGIQILLDSRDKDFDLCVRDTPIISKVAAPIYQLKDFGYNRNLERVKQ